MKYKNVTDDVKNIKRNGVFHTLEPGEVISMPGNMEIFEHGLEKVEEEKPKKLKALTEKELNKMTKDELNDYAAKNGLPGVKSSMKKKTIIQKIIDFFGW